MSTSQPSRQIANPSVLAGLIREALLVRSVLHIDGVTGFVVGVDERDRRDGQEQRTFRVSTQADLAVAAEQICTIILSFARFQVEFTAKVVDVLPDYVSFVAPTVATVYNRRSERRFNAKYIPFGPHPILLRDGEQQYEVSLELIDLSASGYRAVIYTRDPLCPTNGMKLEGTLNTSSGPVDLRSEIVSVSEYKNSGVFNQFQVGCLRILGSTASNKRAEPGEDRRSAPRFASNLQFEFSSPINPSRSAVMTLEDISICGFSARIPSPDFRDMLYSGAALCVVDRDLTAIVVAADPVFVHCQWVGGSEADRAFLLKQISPFIAEGATLSIADATDLLNIFCESGALGGEFLAAHTPYQEIMATEIETESSELPYVVRWIHQAKDGAITGHISAIKAADNMWIVGDVVGGVDPGRKVGRDFLSRFLSTFKLHAEAIAPTPRIFVSYVEGHPYWKEYEAYLSTLPSPTCYRASMSYTRTTSSIVGLNDSSVILSEVKSNEFARIENILKRVEATRTDVFLRALDFSIDQFSSPRLRQQLISTRHSFWRRYYEVGCGQLRFVVVITMFPLGTTPNRLIDSAWCFQLDEEVSSCDDSWLKIVSAIRAEGLRHGVAIPSVRRIHTSPGSYPVEVARLDCRLIHPVGLSYFRAKKQS